MGEITFSSIQENDITSLVSSYDFTLNEEEKYYLGGHAKRIAYFVNIAAKYAKIKTYNQEKPLKVLDIGPHFLTFALHKYLGDNIILNTLGWENRLAPSHLINKHIQFDLNQTQFIDKWLKEETHDIIIMCEVIEHLYTAPEIVLSFIKTLLVPGGVLILGTPNATFFPNRVLMAAGKNPFEKIRKTHDNPGHFREYTANEFRDICREVGLKCQEIEYQNFTHKSSMAHQVVKTIGTIHKPFSKYLCIVCQN
jgi:SAM-dependent methyltransferase